MFLLPCIAIRALATNSFLSKDGFSLVQRPRRQDHILFCGFFMEKILNAQSWSLEICLRYFTFLPSANVAGIISQLVRHPGGYRTCHQLVAKLRNAWLAGALWRLSLDLLNSL